MNQTRPGCAARLLYRDKHLCVTSWWTITSPESQTYELCSGACLVSFAVLGALPSEPAAQKLLQAALTHASSSPVKLGGEAA